MRRCPRVLGAKMMLSRWKVSSPKQEQVFTQEKTEDFRIHIKDIVTAKMFISSAPSLYMTGNLITELHSSVEWPFNHGIFGLDAVKRRTVPSI